MTDHPDNQPPRTTRQLIDDLVNASLDDTDTTPCDRLRAEIFDRLPPDRDDLDAVPELAADMHLTVIDVAAHGRRLYGDGWEKILPPGTPVLEHDYRFELAYQGTGRVSFNPGADAGQVARYIQDMLRERARRAAHAQRKEDAQ